MIQFFLTDSLYLNGEIVDDHKVIVHLSNGQDIVAECNKFNLEVPSEAKRWIIDGHLNIGNMDDDKHVLCEYIAEQLTGNHVVFRSKGTDTVADEQDEQDAATTGHKVIYAYPEQAHEKFVDSECIGVGESHILLSNGKTIDTNQVLRNGKMYYVVDGQWFTRLNYAHTYFRKRVIELLTGSRIIFHKQHPVPDICGVNGMACRAKGECNTAICSYCPVAENFFAVKNGVNLIYAI